MGIKTDFKEYVQKYGAEFQNIQTVRLGNLSRVVETGTPGLLWARQWNGKEIKVINRAFVPSDFDLRVLVGATQLQPGLWFILLNMEDYLVPAAGGRVGYHHTQHEFDAPDEVPIDRKQITILTARASDSGGFILQVYGGLIRTGNAYVEIAHQLFDLASYQPAYGALYANLEADEFGSLQANVGTNFGAPEVGSAAYIPIPVEGRYIICSVLLHEGQTEISNSDILVPFPVERGGVGAQIFSAIEINQIHNDDFLGVYKDSSGRFRKISFRHFKNQLRDYTDKLFAVVSAKAETFYALMMAETNEIRTTLSSFLGAGSPAGGDLAGTYPDPTVAKMRGQTIDPALAPSIGDSLIYDGSQWTQGSGSGFVLTVEELDGTPSVTNVNMIHVSNATLVDNGGGDVTIVIGSGGGGDDNLAIAMAVAL